MNVYDPGCGAPTRLSGTNGGFFPCGSSIRFIDKTEITGFCPVCQSKFGLDQFNKPLPKESSTHARSNSAD